MAIELKEKKEEEDSISKKIVFLIAFLLFALMVFSYFFLKNVIIVKNEAKITEINQQVSSQKSIEMIEMESSAKEAEILIGDYKVLFDERAKTSNFFKTFENWAHPQIYYSDFSLSIDSRTTTLKGSTDYFGPIIQQMDILKNQALVESYTVSNVKLADVGGVTFDLSITFKQELLK